MIFIADVLVAVASVLVLILFVAVGVFALQILAHAFDAKRRKDGAPTAGASRAPLAVLVPAHDEEEGIAATLAPCWPSSVRTIGCWSLPTIVPTRPPPSRAPRARRSSSDPATCAARATRSRMAWTTCARTRRRRS
jgi:hypothetical protein